MSYSWTDTVSIAAAVPDRKIAFRLPPLQRDVAPERFELVDVTLRQPIPDIWRQQERLLTINSNAGPL
jgi:hypothetical protein